MHDELEQHPRQLACLHPFVVAHVDRLKNVPVHEHLEVLDYTITEPGVRQFLDKPFSQPSPQQPLPPDWMITWKHAKIY